MTRIILTILLIFATQSIFSQHYYINFEGIGASTNVENISVENLTQGTTVELIGNEVLHLAIVENVQSIENLSKTLKVFPNPMSDLSIIEFYATTKGKMHMAIYDITGKKAAETERNLETGLHKFQISGLKNGLYFLSIKGGNYHYSENLVSFNNSGQRAEISHLQSVDKVFTESTNTTQRVSGQNAVDMNYVPGDYLLFKGCSGDYCTYVTDDPQESKTIRFEFIECRDFDGNNYPVVKIGTQIWMAESIKTTHYRNGAPIPNITDDNEWTQQESGAYCFYDNDIAFKDDYGALYNWYAAIDSNNIAPEGWHVPNKDEIQTLSMAPEGGFSHFGGHLKETGFEHWDSPNTGATNQTGFSARGGGYRSNTDGSFDAINIWGHITWSTTPDWGENSWYTGMDYDNDKAYLYGYYRKCGFSIRCIKDVVVHKIDFEGIGASSEIDSISITNLTKNISVTLNGNDTLLLIPDTISNGKAKSATELLYETGDYILLKGYYDDYCTIVTDDPLESKTITFDFIECRDYDGYNYPIVKIGDQIWMAENLKSTHYRNGEPIPHITDDNEWMAQESGAYCYYDNDASNGEIYGALYNWYAAIDSNNIIAPEGWHVPTQEEIIEFTGAPPGGSSSFGGSLKETGFEHWQSPNNAATNQTGYTAVGGGYRSKEDGSFNELKQWSHIWSTDIDETVPGSVAAWYLALMHSNGNAYTYGYFFKSGFSIRCIKD